MKRLLQRTSIAAVSIAVASAGLVGMATPAQAGTPYDCSAWRATQTLVKAICLSGTGHYRAATMCDGFLWNNYERVGWWMSPGEVGASAAVCDAGDPAYNETVHLSL